MGTEQSAKVKEKSSAAEGNFGFYLVVRQGVG